MRCRDDVMTDVGLRDPFPELMSMVVTLAGEYCAVCKNDI